MTKSILAKRYDTGQLIAIEHEPKEVLSIKPINDSGMDETNLWISPGWVDLQVNGYAGHDFTNPNVSVEDIQAICLCMLKDGVTSFCPTVTTHSNEVILHSMQMIDAACQQCSLTASMISGIHLEGPYISAEDGPRGAHPRTHCRTPDWAEFCEFQEASGGRIKILTLSPEYNAAPEFTRHAVESGVIVSIGHTAATGEQIHAVADAGATMSTHLGNGAHGQLRRHPNYLWDQLADDRLVGGLIADGHHLPPEVLKVFVRTKGVERIFLVSDITSMAGMPAGEYDTSLGAVEVLEDGRLVVAGQRQFLAGAALPINIGILNLMRYAELSLRQSIDAASTNPSIQLKQPVKFDELQPGSDYCLFQCIEDEDQQLKEVRVVATVKNGIFRSTNFDSSSNI
ncbi:MAG: N-acetylglucosamine-6-phosphate deacetylase [Pirellulales bacterium]